MVEIVNNNNVALELLWVFDIGVQNLKINQTDVTYLKNEGFEV